jgi:hypothetical protein
MDPRDQEMTFTQAYLGDDDRRAFPCLGPNTGPLPVHPLLLWWALLYSLSMDARYDPSHWTENIDVDMSALAVELEVVLSKALSVCPQLILHAIHALS